MKPTQTKKTVVPKKRIVSKVFEIDLDKKIRESMSKESQQSCNKALNLIKKIEMQSRRDDDMLEKLVQSSDDSNDSLIKTQR